jgi:hypothetical protein
MSVIAAATLVLTGLTADPPPVVVEVRPIFYRVSRYEVWQNYGVDFQGRFRPRVLYTPTGPVYRYDGAPYPFASVRTLDFMPYATD